MGRGGAGLGGARWGGTRWGQKCFLPCPIPLQHRRGPLCCYAVVFLLVGHPPGEAKCCTRHKKKLFWMPWAGVGRRGSRGVGEGKTGCSSQKEDGVGKSERGGVNSCFRCLELRCSKGRVERERVGWGEKKEYRKCEEGGCQLQFLEP